MHKLECALVRRASLRRPAEAEEEIGAGSMEIVVGVELSQSFDRLKACLQALRFRQRDGTVQLDDGRARQPGELTVQRGDLRPVARVLGVQRGDRGLHSV